MAAPLLGFEGLGLVQGSGWLFRGLDLFVHARDRLALVGRNGAGKTTLLRLIAGQIDFDEQFTSFIGKNDIGKSTIFEALDIFFGNSKPDLTDLCVSSIDRTIEISCVFKDLPDFPTSACFWNSCSPVSKSNTVTKFG